MLSFIITEYPYRLCIVNMTSSDAHDVYIAFSGNAIEDGVYYEFQPKYFIENRLLQTQPIILEEYDAWDLDSKYYYEVLYVKESRMNLQRYYRNYLNNVISIHLPKRFREDVWQIEEVSHEQFSVTKIMPILFDDLYVMDVPVKHKSYLALLKKSSLFERFFTDLFKDANERLRNGLHNEEDIPQFADYLLEEYNIGFETSEGTDVVLSKCEAVMEKLQLSYNEMGSYFMKYVI
ncbi:hypothetical protein [Lysinibacillus sp. 54212]|uniref:hypothetical protein n=1 Tax=Lysinibacillus sp. 54212 TaxID=3119829 RepID=UPI002FC64AD9